jgi:hypothetical protein
VEKIEFEFAGRLADEHLLNFYEASRFQYAASRLLVKLSQFRNSGRFSKNITMKSNVGILLTAQDEGSFRINVDAPDQPPTTPSENVFVNMSLGELMSYVTERLIAKTDDDELISILNAHPVIVDKWGKISSGDGARLEEVIRELVEDAELGAQIYPESLATIERRISELGRQDKLEASRDQVAKIDTAREQKLISMAAPLVTEMATAFRKSADTLKIRTKAGGRSANVFYLNQSMAQDIESTKVDQEITPILGNIIQYNKETGWGKVRLAIAQQPLSFSVPSDQKRALQSTLLSQMGKDQVYLQVYIVRDRAREPVRVIIAGILPAPEK